MHRAVQLTAIALLSAIFVSVAAYVPVLAQAGSTGGTLGKTDKSVSGEREQEKPAHSQHRDRNRLAKPERQAGPKTFQPERASSPSFRGDSSDSNCRLLQATAQFGLTVCD